MRKRKRAMQDSDKTPAQTPDAKKSSGAWKFNLGSAPCARIGCSCRRDAHRIANGVAHECMTPLCECPAFVIGGPDDGAAR